jgi:dienelactone hydrolase
MAVRVELSATDVVIDEIIAIRVTGVQPGQPVTVRARIAMADRWRCSHASFVGQLDGTVDLSVQAPVSGTYVGVDPMGLFWSVGGTDRRPAPPPDGRGAVELVAEVGDRAVATATLVRRWARPEIQVSRVRERGLVGELYWEPDRPPGPAVVVVGGSGGGLGRWCRSMAAGLASHGYTALSLAYFGVDGLPKRLSLIPLEYFERALEWLTEHPGVDSERLAVLGASRGAELALLLGATLPSVHAVVAYSPSHVIWSEIAFGFRRPRSPWTYRGLPLPFVDMQLPMSATVAARVCDTNPEAVIPVERIDGSVLAISGEDDTLWPSSLMAENVMERLREQDHPYPHEHLRYAKVGHVICRPYTATRGLPHGGTAQSTAQANEDSWSRVLSFLADALRDR